jgi:outer membrane protein OmpA-like peptidoglycan-associated protein
MKMNGTLLAVGMLFITISACAGVGPKPEQITTSKITPEVAAKYAIYAMMASNSYHNSERVRFPIEKAGWIQVDMKGKPSRAGKPTQEHGKFFAYDIYQRQGADEVVFAFRGTDSKLDYLGANFAIGISPEYRQARKELGEYIKNHPQQRVTVTGHSLGGGLALSASVHHGVDAIAFDPSPRIFDGLGDKHRSAKRVVIYEDGEILAKIRPHSKKFSEVVEQENVYQCSFLFPKGISKHRGDYLALGLLDLGASVSHDLVLVRDALPKGTPSINE